MRKRLGWTVVLGILATLLPFARASACSCIGWSMDRSYRYYDAALIGTVTLQRSDVAHDQSVYTFDYDAIYKGDIEPREQFKTPSQESACGVQLEVGDTIGVFATEHPDHWSMTLCSVTSPQRMWTAFDRLPEPDGQDPPSLVVGGKYKTARTLVLDAQGRTIRYGNGYRPTSRIDVCPGATHSVEIAAFWHRGRAVFTIRDLATGDVVRSLRLPFDRQYDNDVPDVEELECRSPDGELAYLQAADTSRASYPGVLMRIDHGTKDVVFKGNIRDAAIGINHMFFLTSYFGRKVGRVDLATGQYEDVARVNVNTTGIAVAPDESFVSFVSVGSCDGVEHSQAIVVDMSNQDPEVRRTDLEGTCDFFGDTRAIDNDSFAYLNTDRDVIAFDEHFNELGRTVFVDYVWNVDVVDGYVYGVTDTNLLRAALPDGPVEDVRRLPGYASWTVAGEN